MLIRVRRITDWSSRALIKQLNLRGYISRHVPTREGQLHYLEAKGYGSLPPLLVLHGFSAAGHLYDGVMNRMRPHTRRIFAPDLLGHGLSAMPRDGLDDERLRRSLLDFFDRVITEPVLIFGNSLGGAAGLMLAQERPNLVAGLFLVAPGGAPMPESELPEFLSRFRLRTHRDALDFVDRLFQRPHPLRHALAWGTRQQFARPGLTNLIENVEPDDFLEPSDLEQLRMPIEVIWGGSDRVLHPAHLDFFANHLPPHAKVSVVDHFGHTPQMDHPDELHRRLLTFAREVAAESANGPKLPTISGGDDLDRLPPPS
jgi:pimeloyl-ACP methyl ester carboxylesterase